MPMTQDILAVHMPGNYPTDYSQPKAVIEALMRPKLRFVSRSSRTPIF